jgi:hypothetical protein
MHSIASTHVNDNGFNASFSKRGKHYVRNGASIGYFYVKAMSYESSPPN